MRSSFTHLTVLYFSYGYGWCYSESRHGPSYVNEALSLLQAAQYWLTDDGIDNWIINNVRVSQTADGLVRSVPLLVSITNPFCLFLSRKSYSLSSGTAVLEYQRDLIRSFTSLGFGVSGFFWIVMHSGSNVYQIKWSFQDYQPVKSNFEIRIGALPFPSKRSISLFCRRI